MDELPEYILTAASIEAPCQLPESAWDALEEKHIRQWQAAREKHIQDTRQLASYKIESLRSNFGSRKGVLETKIRDNEDMRIKTMYSRELENAAAQFKQKVSEIKSQITQADIHTTLIAKGVITVSNK